MRHLRREASRQSGFYGRYMTRKLRKRFECAYCGCGLLYDTKTLDHVIPRSKGGTNHVDNTVYACKACNNRKGNMFLDELTIERGKMIRGQIRRATQANDDIVPSLLSMQGWIANTAGLRTGWLSILEVMLRMGVEPGQFKEFK